MNFKISILACLVILLGGCAGQKFLPTSTQVQHNQYGSLVHVGRRLQPTLSGELIALDSNHVFVLSTKTNTCTATPFNQISQVSVKYATKKDGAPIILLYSVLFPISHGLFAPISILVNSIASSAIVSNAYTYKNLPRVKLNMFARFPQGIPPNLDINKIKLPTAMK
ncbi:MAG: hypothetical protein ABIQ11_04465 [Saprospiraceae bacterium]